MAGADAPKRLTIDDFRPAGREVEVVDWPGGARSVGLLHLTCQELLEAHFDAREHFRKKGREVDMASLEAFEAEEMLQQVYRMLIDPEAKVADYRICKDAAQARARLSSEERSYFCRMHEQLWPVLGQEDEEA